MKIYRLVRLVLLVTIAILIGVFSHELLEYLHFLVGGVMLLYGAEGIFFPIHQKRKFCIKEYQFYLGLIELLLGIIMMSIIRDFNTICVVWGTWTIVRESYELYETGHKFMHRFPAIFSLALSIIEIVFSILLIVYASEHHALTHVYLLIPELIINGLSMVMFEFYKNRDKRKQ